MIAVLTALTGLILGTLWRELWERLKHIESAVKSLKILQEKEDQKDNKMTFAGPADLDEMTDEERIAYLNP